MAEWERRMVATDKGCFEIFMKGSGCPVCVTHHYSQFNENGDYFADMFTDRHTVILVNLRGAGMSDAETEPSQLGIRQAVLDLEAIRKELSYEKWIFAGHSTGGMIGLLYASEYPQSLEALIVAGSACSHYDKRPDCIYHPGHPQFERLQELTSILMAGVSDEQKRAAISKERTKLSLFRPEKYDEYFSMPIQKKMCAKRLQHFSEYDYPDFDLRFVLQKSMVKTLVICGRHDPQCPVRCSEEIACLMQRSHLVIMEESSHYPFVEEREAFMKAVHHFLEDRPSLIS